MSYLELLILGLLKEGFRYGHEIDKIIEKRHIRLWTKATRVSIYQTLSRLTKKEWVSTRVEKVGKSPERTIYNITDKGNIALENMINVGLGSEELPNFEFFIPIMFMEMIPQEKGLAQIEKRFASIHSLLERLPPAESYDHEGERLNRRALLRFLRAYVEMEQEWLEWLSGELKENHSP